MVCILNGLLARRFGLVFISLYKKGTRGCWSTERDWVVGLVYDMMHNRTREYVSILRYHKQSFEYVNSHLVECGYSGRSKLDVSNIHLVRLMTKIKVWIG